MVDRRAERLARLRGSLAAEEPGARGLERVARNPACQRLRALAMVGITPATAVAKVYGETPREGQSPFALAAGNRFERQLFEGGATRLLELYRRAGHLGPTEDKVVIVPDKMSGTGAAAMARRRALTEHLLRLKLAGDPSAPNIIVKPRLIVHLLGVDHDIEPDVLVAADGDPFYRPGEVKSYPDRGGKTDPADVRGACRQAAVAVVGLRQALVRFGVGDPEPLAPARGDLILRVPGSYQPTLRPMTLQGEVYSVERAINEAPRDLDELERLLASIAANATLDNPAVLDAIPNHYIETCREHCALVERCKQQAVARGDPVLLGSYAREELAAAGSISRTLELLDGRSPLTPQEHQLQVRLRDALLEYERAVSHAS